MTGTTLVVERPRQGRRLAFATVTGLGARMISAALGIVVAAVLARHLGPGSYGSLSLALVISALGSQLVDFGLTQTAVREMVRDPDSASSTAGALLVLRSVLGATAAVVVVILAVSGLVGNGPDRLVVILVATTIPLGGLASTIAVAQAQLRPELLGLLNLVQSILWTATVVALAALHVTMMGFAIGFVITTTLTAIFSWSVARRIESPSFAQWPTVARSLLQEGWMIGVMGLAVTAYYRLDSIMVYRIAGSAEAGLYAAAYRFLDVAQLLPAALLVPLLPIASRALARGTDGEARLLFERVVVIAVAVAMPVVIGLSVHGSNLVRMIYGPEFAPAGPVAVALAWAFLGVCLGWVGTTLTIAARGVRQLWPVTVVVAVLSLSVHVVVIRSFGALGAGWVTAGTEAVIGLAALRIARRAFGAAYPWRRLLRVSVAVACLAVAAVACRRLPILIAIAVPGATYVAALLGCGAVPRAEFAQIMRRNSSQVGS
jgi:O-antigen/teichoic acid export membrane protein